MNRAYDEQDLIAGLRRGDHQAQAALLDLYGEPLLRFLVAVCHVNIVEAEDLAVEALYRAIERIDAFTDRPGASRKAFRNWLFTIARNLWRDQLRRDKRLVFIDDPSHLKAFPVNNEQSDNSRVIQVVREALKTLPSSQRETLLLHYGGLQLREVADILGEPAGTVRQWKRRGIAELTKILKSHPALSHLTDEEHTNKVGEIPQ